MLGFLNRCPHCGAESSFVPEEMECDKALVLWCRHCGNFINQTLTLETIKRWWIRFEAGEEAIEPPIGKEDLKELSRIQERLGNSRRHENILERFEIHLKDFTDYYYAEGTIEDESKAKG